MDEATRQRQLLEHLEAIRRLQADAAVVRETAWPPQGYYLLWHVVIGIMLGCIGAIVSLGANVLGATLFGQHPLQLIRVYLTFPMGEQALREEPGVVLFIGCVLYLATGALYGIAFHLVMSTWFNHAPTARRFAVATAIGLGLWIVNFYFILSWLQPMLLGGNWIVSMVPFWVAGLTHLAFAWTMLAVEFWGHFVPYTQTQSNAA